MMPKTQHMTKIIAHRGDSSQFPENTLEAFAAAARNGADGIEFDVHTTADGILVVHHDYYLGNPDSGHGTIPSISFDSFSHSLINNTYHLPTLEAVFAKFGNTLHYELELKAFSSEAITQAISIAQAFKLTDNIEFTSPHPYVLTMIKLLNPTLFTGYFCPPRPDWMDPKLYETISIANAKLGGINVAHFSPECINESVIAAAHAEDIKVHAANCDTKNELVRLFTLGVDQLSTNKLDMAIAARKQAFPR